MDVSYLSVYQGKAVDGIKITQMLKANAQTAKSIILVVHTRWRDAELLKQSGADGYISRNRLLIIISLLLNFGTTAKRLVTPTRYPPLKVVGHMSHPAPNFP